MTRHTRYVAWALNWIIAGVTAGATGQSGHPSHTSSDPPRPTAQLQFESERRAPRVEPLADAGAADLPILVRPATLAAQIGELAGHAVRVPYARVVGVFNPRVFLIDTATRLPPLVGNRNRVLVFVGGDAGLRVSPDQIVASTVTILGRARTVLGMQVGSEAVWPAQLRPEEVNKLEIRAAVLASSVRTAEGIELTRPAATQP